MKSDYQSHQRVVTLPNDLRIAYIECPTTTQELGVLLLIHGFPQTSHQYRHVIKPLSSAGYHVIVPDYRGAGFSSKPSGPFTKSTMAKDIIDLLDALGITRSVHIVGHDIGGMIAYALASRYPQRVASVVWGECPLPGTTAYAKDRTDPARTVQQFHFTFQSVPDLPEALVAGKERIYLTHFFNKIAYNAAAFSKDDIDHYVEQYSQPGAMRCAFATYRAFEEDAVANQQWLKENGKLNIPAMVLSGAESRHRTEASEMFAEVHEEGAFEVATIAGAGHYIAEENPEEFVRVIRDFLGRLGTG